MAHHRRWTRRPVHIVEPLESRLLFASISWAQPVNGSFGDPTKWSSGTVPGPGDDVIVSAAATTGNYTIDVTSNVSVNSLSLGAGALSLSGASVMTSKVVLNHSSLRLRNATLTASQGVDAAQAVADSSIELTGQSTIHANIDLGGAGLVAANSVNTIDGVITTHGGSGISIINDGNSGDLTVSTGFVVNGSLGISSISGQISKLTIADGSAVRIEAGPQVNGLDQGTLTGSGELDGALINDGEVAPEQQGVPLVVSGNYMQTSAGKLTSRVGRATADFSPSLLQVNGMATLAGTLNLLPLGIPATNGLQNGQADTVMTYASETGSFATIVGLSLRPSINPTSVTVRRGGTGNPGTLPADLAVVGVTVRAKSGQTFVGGDRGMAFVTIQNAGGQSAAGNATIRLFASTDRVLDPTDTMLGTPLNVPIHLKSAGLKIVKFRFIYPAVASNDYYVIAQIASSLTVADTDASVKTLNSTNTAHIEAPVLDFGGVLTAKLRSPVTRGQAEVATLELTNAGNVGFSGAVRIDLNGMGANVISLGTSSPALKLKKGRSKIIKLKFTIPVGAAAGSYVLGAVIDPNNLIAESNKLNNTLTGPVFRIA